MGHSYPCVTCGLYHTLLGLEDGCIAALRTENERLKKNNSNLRALVETHEELRAEAKAQLAAADRVIEALKAVETGITSFEEEFLAHIRLPDGSRVGDFMRPQVALAYETGRMPDLLPALPGRVKR